MPRRMAAPIVSIKHYHQQSNTSVASGAALILSPVIAIANTVLPTATNHVIEGSVLKAIYIEYWLKGEGASDADTQFNFVVYKNPGGSNVMTFTDTVNLMAYDNKKNIFFASQGVIGGVGGGQSIPVLRQWVKLPRGKQRMGLGDRIQLAISTTGQAMQVCGLSVYKEYR